MSMVYITNRCENIYSVGEQKTQQIVKPPKYQSKFREQVRREFSSAKGDHRTMGMNPTPLRPPSNFLRKDEGIRLKKAAEHQCPKSDRRPPVPKKEQMAPKPQTSPINFRVKNIEKVVKAKPAMPKPRYVDTKNGDFHDLCASGLRPRYSVQEKFGRVPKYIAQRLKDYIKKEEQKMCSEEEPQAPKVTLISQEEREQLLKGLRKNWEEIYQKYQSLSVLTDTIPKKQRKTNFEKQLRQLEQDILLIESNKYIYVSED